MKVGLDTFTIYPLKLAPLAVLDYLQANQLAGGQFGGVSSLSAKLDVGELREFRAEADRRGLYTHVSVPTCNPHLVKGSLAEHEAGVRRQIEAAAAAGWHELHASLGGGPERYEHPVPWTQHLSDSAALIGRLAPVLRHHGSRIYLETHGDTTTFELIRLIETVGADVAGICLDTANVLLHCEDPVAAARRAAPYTHLTHTKDGILYYYAKGLTRQGRPPGQGCLDWEQMLPLLAAHAPDLPLSIEDHKWRFVADCFDSRWLALHPDLTRDELAAVMRLAWQCHARILAGTLEEPDAYEAIPYEQQLPTRLASGRDYLKALLAKLKLG